jgi:hypothetical protein
MMRWSARTLTSWPLLAESRRTLLARGVFIPNRRAELALSTSRRVVCRTGTVPSGHDSPPSLHACGKNEAASSSSTPPPTFGPGLATGSSCKRRSIRHDTHARRLRNLHTASQLARERQRNREESSEENGALPRACGLGAWGGRTPAAGAAARSG